MKVILIIIIVDVLLHFGSYAFYQYESWMGRRWMKKIEAALIEQTAICLNQYNEEKG